MLEKREKKHFQGICSGHLMVKSQIALCALSIFATPVVITVVYALVVLLQLMFFIVQTRNLIMWLSGM